MKWCRKTSFDYMRHVVEFFLSWQLNYLLSSFFILLDWCFFFFFQSSDFVFFRLVFSFGLICFWIVFHLHFSFLPEFWFQVENVLLLFLSILHTWRSYALLNVHSIDFKSFISLHVEIYTKTFVLWEKKENVTFWLN